MSAGRVSIHYRRLPDRLRVYDQRIVHEQSDVTVTLAEPAKLPAPLVGPDGELMLESGSLVVWFTYPDRWHDIGRFHDAGGRFSGVYANILTPPVMEPGIWHTTDLYLDVWMPVGGPAVLLDEDEFEAAVAQGLMDDETARRARQEADRLLGMAREGSWPPPIVSEWTLDRALDREQNRLSPDTAPT